MKNSRKQETSIAKKIILFVIITNTFVAALLMILSVQRETNNQKKVLADLINNIKTSSLDGLAGFVYEEDDGQVVKNLTGAYKLTPDFLFIHLVLVDDEDYDYVCFKNKNKLCKKVLKGAVEKLTPKKFDKAQTLEVRYKPDGNEVVGLLKIYYSLETLRIKQRQAIIEFSLIMVLQVLIMTFLIDLNYIPL